MTDINYNLGQLTAVMQVLPLVPHGDYRKDPNNGLTPKEISHRSRVPLRLVLEILTEANRLGPIQEIEQPDDRGAYNGIGTGKYRRIR